MLRNQCHVRSNISGRDDDLPGQHDTLGTDTPSNHKPGKDGLRRWGWPQLWLHQLGLFPAAWWSPIPRCDRWEGTADDGI